MLRLYCASLFLWAVFFHIFPASFCERPQDDALFLTPYIESGRIREAQKLAKVPPLLKGSECFAGYLTVNKSCNSNIFFWLHKSQQGHWEDRPLLVWLQGGFGSSMIGMFEEIGPFFVREKKHAKNKKPVRRKTRETGSARGMGRSTLETREELKTGSWKVREESVTDLRVERGEVGSESREGCHEAETDLWVERVEAESAAREERKGIGTNLREERKEVKSALWEERKETGSVLRVEHVEGEAASWEERKKTGTRLRVERGERKETGSELLVEHIKAEAASRKEHTETGTNLRVERAEAKSTLQEERKGTGPDLRVEHVEAEAASWVERKKTETDLRMDRIEAEAASKRGREELDTDLRVGRVKTDTTSSEDCVGSENYRPKYAWDEDLQLQRRKYAWNRNYNLVFIDIPVGIGFSFTDTDSGYAKNIGDAAWDLLETLTQLYKLFPALQRNKLFFLGSCVGGKLAVSAAHKLYKLHQTSTASDKRHVVPVPAGLLELAAALEPFHIMRNGDRLYLNNLGLLDQQQLQEFNSREQEVRAAARAGNFVEAFRLWFAGLESVKELTGFRHVLDITREYLGTGSNMPALRFVNHTKVRRAIHVGNYEINRGETAKSYMAPDFLHSVKSELEELLTKEPFPVIFFTGQLDIMGTYTMTSDLFTTLEWPYAMEYYKAKRCQFKFGNRVAAYYKTAGSLTDVLVRNVGHWIASAQPRWTFELMETFLENRTAFHCT